MTYGAVQHHVPGAWVVGSDVWMRLLGFFSQVAYHSLHVARQDFEAYRQAHSHSASDSQFSYSMFSLQLRIGRFYSGSFRVALSEFFRLFVGSPLCQHHLFSCRLQRPRAIGIGLSGAAVFKRALLTMYAGIGCRDRTILLVVLALRSMSRRAENCWILCLAIDLEISQRLLIFIGNFRRGAAHRCYYLRSALLAFDHIFRRSIVRIRDQFLRLNRVRAQRSYRWQRGRFVGLARGRDLGIGDQLRLLAVAHGFRDLYFVAFALVTAVGHVDIVRALQGSRGYFLALL